MIYRTGPGSETTAGTRKVNFPFKFLLKTIDFSDGPWIWDHVETMLEARRGANGRKESRAGGKKVGQKVGPKIVKKTRIVIENHRFDHKNNVMLELKYRWKKKKS